MTPFEEIKRYMSRVQMDSFNNAYFLGYITALYMASLLSAKEMDELIAYKNQLRNTYLQSTPS